MTTLSDPPDSPDPRDLLAIAVAVVRPAADRVQQLRERSRDRSQVGTKSTDTDVVTAADRTVEHEIVAALRQARPHDTVLGEEFGEAREPDRDFSGEAREPDRDFSGEAREPDRDLSGEAAEAAGALGRLVRGRSVPLGRAGEVGGGSGGDGLGVRGLVGGNSAGRVRWVLDPIDGTVNYLYGIPWYAVSLAAEVDGQVVAGVVRNPVTGQEWTAVAGRGAWRDGVRLAGSAETRLGHALVATGFGYDPARRVHQAQVVAGLLADVRDIRRLGAASLDLCLAADGTVDAFFEKGLQPWDHAAGGLVAAEAGLTVAGLAGRPAGSRMLVAAPPALFPPLHDRLLALDADGGP